MQKKIITSYEKVPQEVKLALFQKYPDGFEDSIKTHKDVLKGGFFKGLLFESEDVSYLIKFQNDNINQNMEDFSKDDEDDDTDEDDDLNIDLVSNDADDADDSNDDEDSDDEDDEDDS
jgi:hypothetical protein